MSSRTLSVTEPHPSVARSGYIGGGRGGAGNFKKYTPEQVTSGPDATGPASRIPLLPRPFSKRMVAGGRGGAGNMRVPEAEESIFQFDEELVRKREAEAPVYRIGRGGAGNFYASSAANKPASSRKDSTDSSASEGERPGAAVRRGSTLSVFSRRS